MRHLLKRYGFFGSIRLASALVVTKIFYKPARLIRLPFYIRGRSAVKWGKHFTTGVGVRIDALGTKPHQIVIGNRVQLNDYVHIGAVDQVVIGNDVLIASKVFITNHHLINSTSLLIITMAATVMNILNHHQVRIQQTGNCILPR